MLKVLSEHPISLGQTLYEPISKQEAESVQDPLAWHRIVGSPTRIKPSSHDCVAVAPNVVTPSSVSTTVPFDGAGGMPQSTKLR